MSAPFGHRHWGGGRCGVATSRIEFVSTRYSVESPPISLLEFGSSLSGSRPPGWIPPSQAFKP